MIERAVELGVDFFDTADAYGLGHSEVVVGRELSKLKKKPTIATKVGDNFYVQPWTKDFDHSYIENAVENSIQSLGIERVDLYQLHNPALEVIQNGDVFKILEELKEKERIRLYGISLNTPEEARAAMEMAPNLSSIMCPYNRIEQEIAEIFEEAGQRGIAIIARSPLASGSA